MLRRIPLIGKLLLRRKLNAPDLLTKQHIRVEALLMRCKVTRERQRRQKILQQIKSDLGTHAESEENIFYPASEQYAHLAPLVRHFYEEHQQMRDLLNEMTEIPADSKLFDRRLNELIAVIDEHVSEEENDLFPRVRRFMTGRQLMRLGDELRAYQAARAQMSAT